MTIPARLPTIGIAVCTYNRNEALATLLRALLLCQEVVRGRARVGVVIVDDTASGNAECVLHEFRNLFELGLVYRISGHQNISRARNLAIETSAEMADWVAMTDDDCEPPPDWLDALLEMQERTGADAVTGRMIRRPPAGAPSWLTEQPFLQLGVESPPDGADMSSAATFNSLISSRWLKSHPDIRFNLAFGVVGGEDMIFYRAATAAGLKIKFSEKAFVYENEPPSRATFRYQLRLYFWHGNSSYLSSVESGVSRARMLLHGLASLIRALSHPLQRLTRGRTPQWRFCLASVLHACGKLLGAFGLRVRHR